VHGMSARRSSAWLARPDDRCCKFGWRGGCDSQEAVPRAAASTASSSDQARVSSVTVSSRRHGRAGRPPFPYLKESNHSSPFSHCPRRFRSRGGLRSPMERGSRLRNRTDTVLSPVTASSAATLAVPVLTIGNRQPTARSAHPSARSGHTPGRTLASAACFPDR